MTAPYPRYVQPPTLWAIQEWTGSNEQAVKDYLAAHSISAATAVTGSSIYLLMGSSSPSYASGTSIVLRNDGGGWYVDSTRSSDNGLAPYSDYYVS
ncbi:hypothetical protein LCD36_04435 [Saccharopolyspora sp. 6T]|uniref:hypothetical protein n=1 Tax=Saccharopolyspora sp. 6T TaxID=2877238 RepID=UPI001CD59DB4|nr:hypothetical protein [Saccharopolyspora sp. 6T]MCA1185699.1 hypothetical protein [Saccharopolyspora sp. 6T]